MLKVKNRYFAMLLTCFLLVALVGSIGNVVWGYAGWSKHTIEGNFNGAWSIYATDVDGDGDVDILGAAYLADDITWWENDGSQNFTEHIIKGDFDGAWSVYATDVDSDGDVDILGAAYFADDITWWENDGSQSFTEHTIKGNFNGASSVYATDVDGDGDVDILGTAYLADDITWWENDGSQNFTEHTIKGDFGGAISVYATDVNGDGDVDILGAGYTADDITWWENDGSQNFTEHTIEGNFNGAHYVYATDVDGDGDVDVLGAAELADDITWWENNGSQSFTEHTIKGNFDGAWSVYATDVDGDGDVDVLGAAQIAHDITWWENNGSQSFTEHTIEGNFNGASSVYATDVDGDGDVDVLGAAYLADDITWWENGDSTLPTVASVGTPTANEYYRAATMPTVFSGTAADNNGGFGLNANSTTFTLKRNSDNFYWNGVNSWTASVVWLATTHGATSSNTVANWTSNINMPVWADGTYTAQAKATDKAGNSSTPEAAITFRYDSTPPTDPTSVHSTSHITSIWSTDNTINITWTDATDTTSGLDGYSILWNTNPTTIPDQTKDIEEGAQATTSPVLPNGNSHYFHIGSVDYAGNWQSTVHVGPFFIDTTPPTDPSNVRSTSHTIGVSSDDNTIVIIWTDATDTTSGLDGYSILWNTNPTTIPDQTKDIEEGGRTTTSSALSDSNNYYFHIRSVDYVGNWQSTVHLGPFSIDTTPPTGPTNVHSTSHTISVSSGDNTIAIAWTAATDATSGLDGYSILWNTNPTTIPDQTKDIEEGARSTTSPPLPNGDSHYFHIRSVDYAGNWQSAVHLGPFFIDVIDTTPPAGPTNVRSTSHTIGVWSGDRTVTIAWTDATDVTSGLDGYSILWNTNSNSTPDQTKDIEEGVRTTTSPALSTSNSHYFHIRSVDYVGNWQSAVHLGPFSIDTTPPTSPTNVRSTSHTISVWSTDNTVDIIWTAATDAISGLDGYSILWNTSSNSTPNKTKDIEEGVRTTTSPALYTGKHYFHIRSVDHAGNWQSAVHLGPFLIDVIDTTPPTGPTNVHSPSHTIGVSSTDNTILITWTDATDAISGLDGYSILWNTNSNSTPNQTKDIEEGFPFTTSPALSDGNSHYFHIRSVDHAGNWQSAVHLGPFFIDVSSAPSPTEFELSSLSISPPEIKIGEEVTIRATVTNIGGQSGSGQVIIKFNDEVLDSQMITLDAGASKEISYTTSQYTTGTYTVGISGITTSVIKEVVEEVVEEVTQPTSILWPLIIGLTAGALAIYLIIVILRARGKH